MLGYETSLPGILAAGGRPVRLGRAPQVLDILRNVTTNPPDRVREWSFSAGGRSYTGLFDGTARELSRDNIVWLNREVFVP